MNICMAGLDHSLAPIALREQMGELAGKSALVIGNG